jgi:hypothetical protein
MTDRVETPVFAIGEAVEKYTGDYQLPGEVRAVLTTRAGKVRYVVEHYPGLLHIYSGSNLRPFPSLELPSLGPTIRLAHVAPDASAEEIAEAREWVMGSD